MSVTTLIEVVSLGVATCFPNLKHCSPPLLLKLLLRPVAENVALYKGGNNIDACLIGTNIGTLIIMGGGI